MAICATDSTCLIIFVGRTSRGRCHREQIDDWMWLHALVVSCLGNNCVVLEKNEKPVGIRTFA